MSLPEFSLIERWFQRDAGACSGAGVILGVGDDCAVVQVPADRQLAVTIDTLVAGVHFFPDCDPEALGHKALAVSLSDLAAMGAEPAWATLALTLPRIDEAWLEAFSRGLFGLAREFGVALVGGDTTRGPLTITLQLQGLVPPGRALTRAGAAVGDGIWVSGTPGEAALALQARRGEIELREAWRRPLADRLDRPQARVGLGIALRGVASATIDLSDGLAADLGHILDRSGVGARLDWEALPLSSALTAHLNADTARALMLQGGDDYELCVTVPLRREARMAQVAVETGVPLTRVGVIVAEAGLRCIDARGIEHAVTGGYRHF